MKRLVWTKKVQKRMISFMLAGTMLVGSVQGMDFSAKKVAKAAHKDEVAQTQETFGEGDLTKQWTTAKEAEKISSVYAGSVKAEQEMTREITRDCELPTAVDNSQSPYFPKVDSQGGIGSCTTWAEVYYNFTYEICKARKVAATDDNIMSPAFVYNKIKVKDGGSNNYDAIRILQDIGTCKHEQAPFPYTEEQSVSWYPTEECWKTASQYRAGDFCAISNPKTISNPQDSDLDEMKQYLADGKLITYTTYFKWDRSRIAKGQSHANEWIAYQSCVKSSLHRMTIVGYDDSIWYDINQDGVKQDAEVGAFKIVNSWGTGQYNENKGFIWVSYDALNEQSQVLPYNENRSRIFRSMCVLQEVIPQSSNTYLYTKVNTADRSQNYITIYATAKQNQKVYQYKILPFSNYCNDFHLSLDGSTNTNDGEMVVDLNNVVPDISADTVEDYTWKIYVNDNDADGKAITVKDASIRVGDTPVYEAIDGLNEEIDGQEKEVMMEDPNAFVIKSFKVDKESPVSVGDTITLKADVLGNQSQYEFRFGTIFNGTEYFLSADGNNENYTDSNTLEKSLLYFLPGEGYTNKAVGTHTLFVDVRKKETGEVKRETIPYFKVDDMEITSLSAKLQSPQKVGTKIHLVAEVKNEVYHKYNCHKFYVSKDGKTTCLNPVWDAGYSIDWTPTEAGIYTITYQATSYCGQQEQAMIRYEIKDSIVPTATPVVTTPPVKDTTKVYFDNSYANWGNVYAYVWDNNKVSTVIPMQVVDAEHKIYKAEIPNRYPNILFKNTESNWDKQTYDLQVPTTTNNCYRANSGSKTGGSWYAYTDQSEMKLTTNVELSHSLAYSGGTNVTISGGTAPYTYQYTERVTDRSKNAEDYVYVSDAQQIYGNWFQISQGLHCAGTYITDITVTDAKGVKATCQTIGKLDPVKIVNVKAMKVSPQKVGTEIQLKHDLQDACYYKYGIGSQFTITNKVTGAKEEFYAYYDHTITWTPKVAGKYQISIYICDSAGEEDTFSFDYEIYGGVEPTATPVVTVAPTNTPVVTTEPTATPVVTVAPTNTPVVTTEPTATPVATVAPTNTPVVTTAPTATPVVTVAPTNTPVVTTAPTATPVVTVAPTNTPVVTTAPTATPVVTVAPTNTPIADTTVVYFDNSQAKWSKVYAYVWDSNKTSTELSTTKIANNIYKVEVPNRYANIIFKNTSKTWNLQTNDLLVPKNANNCYKAYSGNRAGGYWYAYQPVVTTAPTATPVVTVAPTNTPVITTAPTATPVVTVAPTNTPVITTAPTATPVVTIAPTSTPVVTDKVAVEFNNKVTQWKQVYAYVWNNGGQAKVFAAAYDSNNRYIFNIEGRYANIIFKNTEKSWDQQTADLKMPSYTNDSDAKDKCFTPSSKANRTGGTWGSAVYLKDRKSFFPVLTANKTVINAGEELTLTLQTDYETPSAYNSRGLELQFEDGTQDVIRSFDGSSYTDFFSVVSGYQRTYSWGITKRGTVRIRYFVVGYEDHGEYSQPITVQVR